MSKIKSYIIVALLIALAFIGGIFYMLTITVDVAKAQREDMSRRSDRVSYRSYYRRD